MVNMEHVTTIKYFEVGRLILLQQIIFSQSNFTERMLHCRHGQGGHGGNTQLDDQPGQV